MAIEKLIFSNLISTKTIFAKIMSLTAITLFALTSTHTIAHASTLAGSTASARELLILLNVPTLLEETIYTSLEDAKADMVKRGRPQETINNVTNALKAEMMASMPALIDEIAFLYARSFTQVELDELIKFYSSPTGQKFVAAQSSLKGTQSKILRDWLDDVRERTRYRLASAST